MKEYLLLVSPEEAVRLAEHSWPYSYCHAREIAEYSEAAFKKMFSEADPRFNYLCMIQAVFEAGRIQGIREERSRRRRHGGKA